MRGYISSERKRCRLCNQEVHHTAIVEPEDICRRCASDDTTEQASLKDI